MRVLLQVGLVGFLTIGCAGPNYQGPTGYQQSQQQSQQYEPSPQRNSPPPATGAVDVLTLLEGCVIVANDGQPLGVITQNEFAANSILNEFGKYGSEFSATSIFNKFGKYGSEFSQLSPFNEFSNTPPQIIDRSANFIGYLTKNRFKTPAIDPHALVGLLKSAK